MFTNLETVMLDTFLDSIALGVGASVDSVDRGTCRYNMTIHVDEQQVIVHGWRRYGYTHKGAMTDIGGGPTDIHGKAQPGGWNVVDHFHEGDGVFVYGKPYAYAVGWVIFVKGANELVQISLQELEDFDADFVYDKETIQSFVDVLNDAIAENLPDVDEPVARDIWLSLGERAEIAPGVRIGSFNASKVVVVYDGDAYTMHLASHREGWMRALSNIGYRVEDALRG